MPMAVGGAVSNAAAFESNTSPSAMENIRTMQKAAVEQAQKSGGAGGGLKDLREKLAERIQNDGGVFSGVSKESLAKMFVYRPSQGAAEAGTAKMTGLRLSYKDPSTASAFNNAASAEGASSSSGAQPYTGCKTCEGREYQDGSDDPGVSFQTPGHIPASMSGVKVASHEGEHSTRETEQAQKEGRVITNKKVTMQMAVCPECHRMYAAGGTTTVSTMDDPKNKNNAEVSSIMDLMGGSGENFDDYV